MDESTRTPADLPPAKKDDKVFNDPIHGSIRLHSLLVKIIDTPQFQRLRYIKQLGGKYFVYPGASHNRFEHSIGVAHLAGKLVEKLQHDQPELNITEKDVLCVKIAGLCHDLGHGPFSHVWDGKVTPKILNSDWKHEQGSIDMLKYLIAKNEKVKEEFMNLSDKDKLFIEELIDPKISNDTDDWSLKHRGRSEEKSFLYEIVSNKRNGIDVDKWDYFKRDCHHLGLTCVFDIDRAMQFIRVLKPDGERRQICFRDKEARNIFQMFQTRELLHRQAYMHKTSRVIEHMLADALILADQSGFIIPTGRVDADGKAVQKKMSQFTEDPELYTNLTDHVFQQILTSSSAEEDSPIGEHPTKDTTKKPDPEKLKMAKKLLVQIQNREQYKYLGELSCLSSNADDLYEKFIGKTDGKLEKKDVFHDPVTFNFGMKHRNPFEHIMFFSKQRNQDEEPKPKRILLSEVSSFLPEKFQEKVVRFYCKSMDKVDGAQTYFDDYKEELQTKQFTPEAKNGMGRSPGADTSARRRIL